MHALLEDGLDDILLACVGNIEAVSEIVRGELICNDRVSIQMKKKLYYQILFLISIKMLVKIIYNEIGDDTTTDTYVFNTN